MSRLRRLGRPAAFALLALSLGGLLPAAVSAHPLGNFTINHYAEVRVGERLVQLDVVIDMAEIPTFSERAGLDANRDGTISADELEAARGPACMSLSQSLAVAVDGVGQTLRGTAAGLQLLPGAGGLQTMRIVCEFDVPMAQAVHHAVHFEDRSYPQRIGWREIVATGDGTTLSAPGAEASTLSHRLTAYPTDLLTQPPDVRSVTIQAVAGGTARGPLKVPDAQPLNAASGMGSSRLGGAVPGGVGDELASLVGARELTPLVIVLSLLIAAGLGAAHAISPGHGKTVMAAYLVGTRGRARHAVGLALSVTVSHTTGVVVLALVTLLASDLISPDRLYPVLGLGSGLIVTAIGLWLLIGRWRQLRLDAAHRNRDHAEEGHLAADHHHTHAIPHGEVQHRHGPFRHRHGPPPRQDLTWRRLVALGLAGGLVPSPSALILLLGAVAAGRPAYGLALAVAFGVGMAVVLGGIGLVLSQAGRLVPRAPRVQWLVSLAPAVPWLTACVVVVAGVALTGQALAQPF